MLLTEYYAEKFLFRYSTNMKTLQLFTICATFLFLAAAILAPVHVSFAASNLPVQESRMFTGTVTDVSENRIEMFGMNRRGQEQRPKFAITENTIIENGVLLFTASEELRHAVKDEIRRGSVVTIWYSSGGHALVIKNMAPKGQGDFYGPVDCPSCGN